MRRSSACLLLLAITACSSPTSTAPPPGDPTLRALFNATSVGAGGGVLRYNSAGDPLDGLTVTVPAGAYTTASQWTIVADSTAVIPLPAGFAQVGPALAISNDHPGYAVGPITIRVPMVKGADYGVAPFYYNPGTGKFEGIPMVDVTATYATLAMENFSTSLTTTGGKTQTALRGAAPPIVARCVDGFGGVCVVWVRIAKALIQGTYSSSFRPGRDDWEFVNGGDYAAPDGTCEGMSITSMYYWYYVEGSSGLYHQYDISLANKWDNVLGIRFAGSVQADYYYDNYKAGVDQISALAQAAGGTAANNDPVRFLTSDWLMITFKLTQQPVMMHLTGSQNGTLIGHVVVAYAGTQSGTHTVISFADPNLPGTARTMTFENGVLTPVSLQPNVAASPVMADRGYALSVTADIPMASITQRWVEFKSGLFGLDRYPRQYSWVYYNPSTTLYDPLPAVLNTSSNKFYAALLCPGCSNKVAGASPADLQQVVLYDATGATPVPPDAATPFKTLAIGSNTFVLAAFPKTASVGDFSSTGFLDSRTVTINYSPGSYTLTPVTGPLNLVPGNSATNILLLNRVNQSAPITITAASDAGITITPSESPSPGSQTTLTVNMPSSVVVGTTHTVFVTGTALDLQPVTTSFAVVAVPTPAITQSVRNAPLSIPAGSTSLPDFLDITRTNFAGAITLSGIGDNGITVTVTTQPGTGSVGTFTVNVPITLPPNQYNVQLTTTSSLGAKSSNFAVIVQAPSAYTLSVQDAPLTLFPGTTSAIDVVTATRTNFGGSISLSGVADSGSNITVNFSGQPGSGNTGTFTVSVPAGLAPGTYFVVITGASTLANVQTQFAVVVQSLTAPGFTFAVAPDPLNVVINRFPNYAYAVTLNRTTSTAAVTVSATTTDTGLVVTPNPAPAILGNNLALTVSVHGGVSVGTHVIQLRGASIGHTDLVTSFSVVTTLPVGGTPAGIVIVPGPTNTLRVGSTQQFVAYLVDAVGNRTDPAPGWGISILSDLSAVAQDQASPAYDATQRWQTHPVKGVGVGTTPVRAAYYRLSDGNSTFVAITSFIVTP